MAGPGSAFRAGLSLRPLADRFPRRVLLARRTGLLTRLRPGTGPTLHLLTHKARLDLARSLRSLPARPGPLTSLSLSPSMQANPTSRLHRARMARFVAPPPLTLLLLYFSLTASQGSFFTRSR